MRGVITFQDVVSNLGLVLREYGTRCVVRCLWASLLRRRTTFLELAVRVKDT